LQAENVIATLASCQNVLGYFMLMSSMGHQVTRKRLSL
jgi:hypothetical protein